VNGFPVVVESNQGLDALEAVAALREALLHLSLSPASNGNRTPAAST
jgi:hypothetical protein